MKVFTTMRPWEPLEVDAREAQSLQNMGLLVDEDSAPAEPEQARGSRGAKSEK